MIRSHSCTSRARLTSLVATFTLITQPVLAQTGTLMGHVTNLTGAPIGTAQVAVSNTRLGASVDADGRFRITSVPVTAHEVVVHALGFTPTRVAFTLTPNGTATVGVRMTTSLVELNAIVVTGTGGDTRRRAVGNSVATLDAAEVVGRSAVSNVVELLQAKVPGLTLLPGSGTIGTAANLRLRGAGSLYAGTSPIVYVDGIRVSARTEGSYNESFGQATSALDAINPADIESIEITKGPAAAALYGADAGAGVLQILTRKGRAGQIKWTSRLETARSDWPESLRPENFAILTAARMDSLALYPGFVGKSVGDIISFRPMSDGRALRTGKLAKLFLSASGGADRYNFFVSGGQSKEDGVQFNNFSNLGSIRANLGFVPSERLTFTTNVALSRNHIRLPINDNGGPLGLVFSSYLAIPGRSYVFPGGPNYSTITPEVANTYDSQIRADRFIVGSSAEYAPFSWLRNVFRLGLDANVGQAELYFPPVPVIQFLARGSQGLDNTKGFLAEGRPLTRDVTLNYDGTASRRLSSMLLATTSVGVQYLANEFRRTDATGLDLGSAGIRSISSAAVTSSTDSSSSQRSLGFYAQQQLSRNDRLFATLALRVDNNSALGSRLTSALYPKASLSYVISEEPFFHVPGVSSLRLRAAWGQAGNVPGPFDATRSYVTSRVTTSAGTVSGLQYGAAGNPDLRAERTSEVEIGFEGTFFDGRVVVDGSHYDKTTRDALMQVAVKPSTGFAGFQLTNLGTIANAGFDLLVTATPVQRKSLTVDASFMLATNHNELVSFGYARGPEIFGSVAGNEQRHQEGFPTAGMWEQRVQYIADGTLRKVNGQPVPDSVNVYVGPSVPTREMAITGGVRMFGRLRVFALADYKGGHYQFNGKDWRRDRAGVSWETVNPAANPEDVLVRSSPSQTFLAIQPADFVKLRDVSLSYDVPVRLLYGVAERATVTLAGHNLKTWTKYGGADPELNNRGAMTFNRDDSWTVPQTRRYSAAIALNF